MLQPLLTPQGLARYVRRVPRELTVWYRNLSRTSKKTIWYVTLAHLVALTLVILITPTRIGQWFNAFGIKLRGMGVGGMFLLGLMVVLSSHPPLIGFSGSMTLIGFTWGVWPGFAIASTSCLLGAAISFLSVRRFFLSWVQKRSNDKWDAFGRVMREKGLPLVIMIRYCPVPWALSNGLFASVESVKFWHYMVATLCLQPRLFIPVFIGSRLNSLTDENATHDPLRTWLNILTIALSFSFSLGTGYWIYRLTLEQMRKMDREGGMEGELAAEALEEGEFMGPYEDDEEDEPLTARPGSKPFRPNGGVLRRVSSSGESV